MSSITIHPPSPTRHLLPSGTQTLPSPLPNLLRTPAGLALIEIQGTINHPPTAPHGSATIPIGRLEFPDYRPGAPTPAGDGAGGWQKRVWLYIGDHQRMTGEVRKLAKPFGVLKKRAQGARGDGEGSGKEGMEGMEGGEELEIVEVIAWKIVFGLRPEPVGVATGA